MKKCPHCGAEYDGHVDMRDEARLCWKCGHAWKEEK